MSITKSFYLTVLCILSENGYKIQPPFLPLLSLQKKSPGKVSNNFRNSEIIPQFFLQAHMKCSIQCPHCSKLDATAIRSSVLCILMNRSEHCQCQNSQDTMLKNSYSQSVAEVFQGHLNILVLDYLNRFEASY